MKRTRGEDNPRSKLTEEDVLDIRRRRAAGEKLVMLATEFGVNPVTISRISSGENWRHVGGERTPGIPQRFDAEALYQRWAKGESIGAISASIGYYNAGVSLLINQAGGTSRRNAEIVSRWKEGATITQVAIEFGLSRTTVSKILVRGN